MVQKIERVMKQKLPQQTLSDFDYGVPKPEYPQSVRKPVPRKKRTSPSQPKQHARRTRQTTGSGIG
jgi:hypothetical protein